MEKRILEGLKPEKLFYYFEELSRIPRGSGNERGVSDYLVKFAKEHNLEVVQDSALNIVIKKPATFGYENAKTVILQGHMDMVCEKNIDTVHDFLKDSIKLQVEGDFIKASGTTLGADNGVAVAMAMAILADNSLSHPSIEVLVTSDEENGMTGAMALTKESLKGRMLVNIDSEEEGKLLVSCAGGTRSRASLNIEWIEVDSNLEAYALRVRGLKGGHSGMEINKERANSNKLMGRILRDINEVSSFSISNLNGGSKNNAIPREADATLLVNPSHVELIKERVEVWNATLKNEFKTADPNVKIIFEKLDTKIEKMFSKDTIDKAIKLLYLMPNGIMSMSMDINGLVESSTNLGVVTTKEDCLDLDSAVRSSIRSLKNEIVYRSREITNLIGAEFTTQSDYPEWQYNKNSELRNIFEQVYTEMYNIKPEIVAIHAGVECGLFEEIFGDIDMISFGPNIYDVHTPDEHFSITSTERTYEYLLNVLKTIK